MGFFTVGRGSSLPYGAEWIEGNAGWWRREPSDANVFHEISRAFPDATGYRRLLPGELPTDRSYRDAWRDDGKKIHHHMPKAREIHLGRLRRQRGEVLAELDKKWMIAMGADDKHAAKAIEAKRQALRDMPVTKAPALEAAQTTEDLKTITLDE